MSLHQTTERMAQAHAAQTGDSLERGMFVAGMAVGVAPAVAAAGLLLDNGLLAIGVTSGLLVTAFLTAALSSDL